MIISLSKHQLNTESVAQCAWCKSDILRGDALSLNAATNDNFMHKGCMVSNFCKERGYKSSVDDREFLFLILLEMFVSGDPRVHFVNYPEFQLLYEARYGPDLGISLEERRFKDEYSSLYSDLIKEATRRWEE